MTASRETRVRKQNPLRLGGQDPFIPRPDVRVVEAAVASHPGAEIHVQEDAGHAFHNRVAPMFHRPEAAARAWDLTVEFLARTLPVTPPAAGRLG
ncbi:dienelactone hydrolase family protein [Amycolatopsis sp. NPDC049253]|uniref:dienelactone hydrolase family protein n=1 Tax=Amycolatopsis sp. NPDC049253 TaxID=3155274 RepID=UPI003433677C